MSKSECKQSISLRAEEAIRAVLPHSSVVRKLRSDSAHTIRVSGKRVEIHWIAECGLRQARGALEIIRKGSPTIIISRRTSPGAREVLSKAGVGWIDETGAAEIVLDQIIISKSGRPDERREREPKWNPSTFAVAEALLSGTKGTVATTAEATTLSPASCTYALQTLTSLKLLTAGAKRGRESARNIEDSSLFLDAYAAAVTAQKRSISLTVGVTWQDFLTGLAEAGKKWEKAGRAWAATGSVAAAVMAPLLTSVNTGEVFVDVETIAGLEAVAADAGFRPIEAGRLTLLPFPTVTAKILSKKQKGISVAPWPRVYADLKRLGVRGEEAAEHLREVMRG